jgi:hypothetical protein
MKKVLLFLPMVLGMMFISCKKEDDNSSTNGSNSSNGGNSQLDEYLTLDGITLNSGYSNHTMPYPEDTSLNYHFRAYNLLSINLDNELSILLPRDSAGMADFDIGEYKMSYLSGGSTDEEGVMVFNKNVEDGKYTSQEDPNSKNTISSITYLRTEYDNFYEKMVQVFLIKGSFTAKCKHNISGGYKTFSGEYQFELEAGSGDDSW